MLHSKSPPVVLSISGSDPSGGAGIEADLKTFQQHGVYGMAISTLLTAQNASSVQDVQFLDPNFLEKQWDALFADVRPDAIKIGALGSRKMTLRIAKLLSSREAKGIPVVLDPVLGSSTGTSLLEQSALPVLMNKVFPLCRIITPNAVEFSILSQTKVDRENAEPLLRGFGKKKPYAILLKGGHLHGSESIDLLWDNDRVTRLRSPRLLLNVHGTGCVLASAIAARLAMGQTLPTACRFAKTFVHEAIATAIPLGKSGKGTRSLNLWI